MEINGVDVDALKAGLEQVQKDPSSGQYIFRATTIWARGARSASRIRDFALEGDETNALFGSNQAPNPVEQILAALGVPYGWNQLYGSVEGDLHRFYCDRDRRRS